jgi:nucleotide-binding universal stress UspA family protein
LPLPEAAGGDDLAVARLEPEVPEADPSAPGVRKAYDRAEGAGAELRAAFLGWAVLTDACAGSPAGALVERAERLRADLVVVGSRGRSELQRLVLGSVSQQVVTAAHTSVRVEVVRSRG